MTDQLERSVSRFLSRVGESATIHDWSDDGTTDEYGDPDLTHSSTSTTAVFRRAAQPREFVTPRGQTVTADARVWVADTVSITGTNAGEDTPKPTHIERDRDGTVFKAITPWNEGNGFIRVWCVELPNYDLP